MARPYTFNALHDRTLTGLLNAYDQAVWNHATAAHTGTLDEEEAPAARQIEAEHNLVKYLKSIELERILERYLDEMAELPAIQVTRGRGAEPLHSLIQNDYRWNETEGRFVKDDAGESND